MKRNELARWVGVTAILLTAGAFARANSTPVEASPQDMIVMPAGADPRGDPPDGASSASSVDAADTDLTLPGVCTGTTTVPALVTVQLPLSLGFIVRVTNQALLDQMINICLGNSPQLIVMGRPVTGNGGYNRNPSSSLVWSWHLAEDSITLTESAIELCDARPTLVESDLEDWVGLGMYCPWSSQIVKVDADNAIAGDIDVDGSVDLADYSWLARCITGPSGSCYGAGTQCCAPDRDGDADVDLADFSPLQAGFPAGADDCCEAHPEPGCNDPQIEACVCARAPYCCLYAWSWSCVAWGNAYDCGECAIPSLDDRSTNSSSDDGGNRNIGSGDDLSDECDALPISGL